MADLDRASSVGIWAVVGSAFSKLFGLKPDCEKLGAAISQLQGRIDYYTEHSLAHVQATLGDDQGMVQYVLDMHKVEHMKARYEKYCRPDSVKRQSPAVDSKNDSVRVYEISHIVEPSFIPVILPEATNSTVAAAGAEGVYGASPLTFWEAAIVREVKAMGESAKELALPVMAFSVLALGVVKAVRTGDTSIMQRAWAMVRQN